MRIIYKDSEGVNVIIPSPHYKGTLKELAKKRVPEGLAYKIVSDDSIPADRYFRNAWDIKSGKVVTDITKAKEIKKEILRRERKEFFTANDILFMEAVEEQDNEKLQKFRVERQKLRDITKEVDKLKSVDELKAFKIEGAK
jgi:hypothetical protein